MELSGIECRNVREPDISTLAALESPYHQCDTEAKSAPAGNIAGNKDEADPAETRMDA